MEGKGLKRWNSGANLKRDSILDAPAGVEELRFPIDLNVNVKEAGEGGRRTALSLPETEICDAGYIPRNRSPWRGFRCGSAACCLWRLGLQRQFRL